MKIFTLSSILLSFCISQLAYSQNSLSNKNENTKSEKNYLKQRFDDYHGSRMLTTEHFQSALKAMTNSKNFYRPTHSSNQNSGWIPIGPNVIAENQPGNNNSIGIGRMSAVVFHPTDSNILYTVVGMGGLWKSTNHGKSWIPLTDNFPNLRVSGLSIDPKHPDTMYLCTGDYNVIYLADLDRLYGYNGTGIYKTTDGGETWNATGFSFEQNSQDSNLVRKVIINSKNSNHLLAVGYNGIYKSLDGGNTWTKKANNFMYDIDAAASNDSVVIATSGYVSPNPSAKPGIYRSLDFGDTWTFDNLGINIPSSVLRIEVDLSSVNDSIGFAVVVNNFSSLRNVLKTRDKGKSWTEVYSSNNNYNILAFGTIKGAQVGGQGFYDCLVKTDPMDTNSVYVGGINMWGSNDGGKSFLVVSNGESLHSDQHALEYNPLDKKFYCVNDGGMYRTSKIKGNDPNLPLIDTKWENLNDGIQVTSFYRLGININNENILGGGAQDNNTYFFDGNNWQKLFGGDGMDFNLDPRDESIVWGSSQSGFLYYSSDYGKTFTAKQGAGNGLWTTPMRLNPQNPSVLYAGYFNMNKLESIDKNWEELGRFSGSSGAPLIVDFDIQQLDSNTIYAFRSLQNNKTSKNKLLVNKTLDGGKTWINITSNLPKFVYAKSIIIDPLNKDKAWLTFGDYVDTVKVYSTVDGGLSWKNISKNLPNTPVNKILVHNFSTVNMLYIGTDLGVFYTNDTMSTWEPFNENLPNVVVSDLEINYSKNKLFAATFGRGMWKTDLIQTTVDSSKIGISNLKIYESDLQIFPNPNEGQFDLNIISELQNFNFEIVDIMGRQVYRTTIQKQSKLYTQKLDLKLLSGIYFAKIESGNKSKVIKFLVN